MNLQVREVVILFSLKLEIKIMGDFRLYFKEILKIERIQKLANSFDMLT